MNKDILYALLFISLGVVGLITWKWFGNTEGNIYWTAQKWGALAGGILGIVFGIILLTSLL